MAKSKAGRVEKARAEIESLKATKRKCLIKILIAVGAMMLLILGKTMLEFYYILPTGSPVTGGMLALTAFVLAVFAGSAGLEISKANRSIAEIRTRNGLS